MSTRTKDFLERLGFTVLFVAVGLAIPYFTGINEAWAVPVVAGLQIIKNLVAQQVGDPETSGFTDPLKDTFDADELPAGDPDGVSRDVALDTEIADTDVVDEGVE